MMEPINASFSPKPRGYPSRNKTQAPIIGKSLHVEVAFLKFVFRSSPDHFSDNA
jgi:hypothetical protein